MTKEHAPLPFYPWYVTRYRAHRKVQRMNYIERGLYRELLDECWEEGQIPDDMTKLAEIARCPVGVMAEAWPNLRPCFAPVDGLDGMFLQSPRLEQVRSEQDAFRLKQSQRRRAGAVTADNHGQPRLTNRVKESKEEKSSTLVTQAAELPTAGELATRPIRTAAEWAALAEPRRRGS